MEKLTQEQMAEVFTQHSFFLEVFKEAEKHSAASSGDNSIAASSGHHSSAASFGNQSSAASSGNSSIAASLGNSSIAASSGHHSSAASSGQYSNAASSGDSSSASSLDVCSSAASSGYYSNATSSGDRSSAASSGQYSKAISWGICSSAASSGDNSSAASSGNNSSAASSGHWSKAASSGQYSSAASSGGHSSAASSGNQSSAASSGDRSSAASSDDFSKAASSGYCSKAASSGKHSAASAIGYKAAVKGDIGNLIMASEYSEGGIPLGGKASIIDGVHLKPATWYIVENGEWVEVDLTDGLYSYVISKKGNVTKVKTHLSGKTLYIVRDLEGNAAHGKTIKEAKADLIHKRTMPLNFIGKAPERATAEEWVGLYRIITGACSAGVKHFVEQNNIDLKKEYSREEISEITKGYYGHEKFLRALGR